MPTKCSLRPWIVVSLMLAVMAAHAGVAVADNLTVVCGTGGPGAFPSISAALASLPENSPTEPHIITVNGTCTEQVVVNNRQRITIQAPPSAVATIAAISTTADVFVILRSRAVTLRRLTIQGGNNGVLIDRGSEVTIEASTVQNNQFGLGVNNESLVILNGATLSAISVQLNTIAASVTGGSALSVTGVAGGVLIDSNQDGVVAQQGASVSLGRSTINGNNGIGLAVSGGAVMGIAAGQVTNNGSSPNPGELQGGVFVGNGGVFGASGTNISNNTGDGVTVGKEQGIHATARLSNAIVSGNTGNGIFVSSASALGLIGSTISGNALAGVSLSNSSTAGLPDTAGSNTFAGNGDGNIVCDDTSHAFGDLSGIRRVRCRAR